MKLYHYLFILICFIPLLLFRDFTPNNELKYLSIADEALRDGHIFTFWNHGIIYADKPPLYFWIIMLGKWAFGTHSMIFLGLFSILPAFVILYIMDKWTRHTIAAQLRINAQLLLITTGLFLGSAVILRMDMLMCMFIILSLYTFYKLYSHTNHKYDWLKLPLFIFLAIFSKGPVGLLVPVMSIYVFLIIQGQWRQAGQYLGWKQWGILLSLCLLWFGGVLFEGGKDYLHNLLFNQTVNRAIDAFDHKKPFWYYFQNIWLVMVPWILFYFITIFLGIRNHLMNTDLKKFFLTIIITTFISLSLFSGKLDIYMLPIYPFVTYLTFLIFPDIQEKFVRLTIALPAFILCLTFPGILIAGKYLEFNLPSKAIIVISGFILSLFSIISLIYLFQKHFYKATNSLAIGLLLTILTGSLAISGLNSYLGFRKICQKATTLAHENRINNYYYFQFRSGENIDVYLKQEINKADLPLLNRLEDKQKIILFVKNKDLKKNLKLQEIIENRETYIIGNYSLILY